MPRERSVKIEAIVLRRSDFGEADRLLTLYSRELGKVKAIAKGARKPQSRKTGHVELFMRTQFVLAQGRDLDIITQAEMIAGYQPLREDLVHTTYAAYLVELLDAFTPEEEKNRALYELLVNSLTWLAESRNFLLIARYYELRLLALAGYQPQLFQCVGCGTPVQEQDQFFSAEQGGILCPECAASERRARPISAAAVKVLRFLQTRSWDSVKALQLRRPLHTELESILHFYIVSLLERELRSTDFLHRLRREAALFADDRSESGT